MWRCIALKESLSCRHKAISSGSVSSHHKNVNQNAGFKASKRKYSLFKVIFLQISFDKSSFFSAWPRIRTGQQKQKRASFLLLWKKTDYRGVTAMLRPTRPWIPSITFTSTSTNKQMFKLTEFLNMKTRPYYLAVWCSQAWDHQTGIYMYIHGVVLGIWKLQILMYGINLNYGKCIVIVHNELSYTPRIRECSWGSLGVVNRGHCQTWYLSIFLYQHIFKFLKIYPKKCVNRDILNLKYHILDVFIHLIGIISQFSYV